MNFSVFMGPSGALADGARKTPYMHQNSISIFNPTIIENCQLLMKPARPLHTPKGKPTFSPIVHASSALSMHVEKRASEYS